MAEIETGAMFSQSGVPVDQSADYQRVYDSRWRFMEIELETTVKFTTPAVDTEFGSVPIQRVNLVRHGIGKVPYFEAEEGPLWGLLRADKDYVYVEGTFTSQDIVAATEQSAFVRVYNIPILEEFTAPKGLPEGLSSPRSNYGIRFLDGHTPGARLTGTDSTGRSFDSSKKMISIHKHGIAYINEDPDSPDPNAVARVTAIDTSTDTLTVEIHPLYDGLPIDWLFEPGAAFGYAPGDFSTYPGGVSAYTYYSIPVDSTHIKLAASYEAALAGTAVDITSTGNIPGSIFPNIGTGVDYIIHDVGYPPSYLICDAHPDDDNPWVGPAINTTILYVTADGHQIRFRGIQSVFQGVFGYIILKDPAEIAR